MKGELGLPLPHMYKRLERDAGGRVLEAEPGEWESHYVHRMCLVMLAFAYVEYHKVIV